MDRHHAIELAQFAAPILIGIIPAIFIEGPLRTTAPLARRWSNVHLDTLSHALTLATLGASVREAHG